MVTVTYPADGASFQTGSTFDITGDASNDHGVRSVELLINGASVASDSTAPYTWAAANVKDGTYTVQLIAVDQGNNDTMSEVVTFTVSASGMNPTTSTGGPTSAGNGGTTVGATASGTGVPTTTDGTAVPTTSSGASTTVGVASTGFVPGGVPTTGESEGCLCRTDPRGTGQGGSLVFLLFAPLCALGRSRSLRSTISAAPIPRR